MIIVIPMEPVAKGRPKFTKRGFTYTPVKTRTAEKYIRAFVTGYPKFAPGLPLAMSIDFYLTKPKSAKKRIHHTVKPDRSNLLKTVEDACNGILYHDDAQIIDGRIRKFYGTPARIELEIEEIEC